MSYTDIFFAFYMLKSNQLNIYAEGEENMIKEKSFFEADYSNGLLAVRILGEIDHHSALGMRQGIDGLIREKRPEKLILDLSSVDFMDSSGLGLILGRYSAVRQVGGDMVVLNPNKGVMKILRLAGAERILRIETVNFENKNKKK